MSKKEKRVFHDEREMPKASISAEDMSYNKTGSWRNVKPFYDPKTSPCIAGCPAGEDIQGYIALAREGKYEEAVRLIWDSNPFPSICGRVCYHPCMDSCARAQYDDAVYIPAIERFLGDYALEHKVSGAEPEASKGERVAVVGGGPAGLACAYFLARAGFGVTIFEAKPKLGGVLRYGIPEYRLPKRILDAELEKLIELGIEIRTETVVGRDVAIEDMTDFSAFFVGVGLQKSRELGLEGEDVEGVMPGLEFLEAVNTGKKVNVGKNVIVVGGGNTAMDVARSAMRLGANVTVLYRRTRAEMPAIEDEVQEAFDEGVAFKFLGIPHEIITKDGRIVEVVCQEMELGEPDDSGRRRPLPKEGAFFNLPADSLLTATGEMPDTDAFNKLMEVKWGLIVTDEYGRTSHRKVFAGGDVVTGASTVVNAVARGRGAAEVISSQLQDKEFNPKERKKVVAIADVNTAYFVHKQRTKMPHANEHKTFDEVNFGFSDKDVQAEVERCFSCGVCDGCDTCYVFCPDVAITRENGVYTIDYDYCKGCLICVQECPRGVISAESEAS